MYLGCAFSLISEGDQAGEDYEVRFWSVVLQEALRSGCGDYKMVVSA